MAVRIRSRPLLIPGETDSCPTWRTSRGNGDAASDRGVTIVRQLSILRDRRQRTGSLRRCGRTTPFNYSWRTLVATFGGGMDSWIDMRNYKVEKECR